MSQTSKQQLESQRRSKLREEKPLAYEKIIRYSEKRERGECIAMIDLVWDYLCNLTCKHCMNSNIIRNDRRPMTLDDIRGLSIQADELGLAQFTISGGEPLAFPDLEDLICALQPDKFHLAMSTNGILLTSEKAVRLKSIGLDKMKISLDSINIEVHEENRKKDGSYQKALDALRIAREAGLSVVIQHVVTHQSVNNPKELEALCEYAEKCGYDVDIVVAKPLGEWAGREDLMIDDNDASKLVELNERFPFANRDVFDHYGMKMGCGTLKTNMHVTKYGDVLPCGFIHITLGNILEEPLKDIIRRGRNIIHFRDYNPKCLAGEDRYFIRNYLNKCIGKPEPVSYKEVFSSKDYIDSSIM